MTITIPKNVAASPSDVPPKTPSFSTPVVSGPPDGPVGRLLTVRQVANHWQLSERHIRRLIASGALRVHHLGRAVRIAERDIAAFERRCL